MTSALMEKIRKDFAREPVKESLNFEAYIAGYLACIKRFGGK